MDSLRAGYAAEITHARTQIRSRLPANSNWADLTGDTVYLAGGAYSIDLEQRLPPSRLALVTGVLLDVFRTTDGPTASVGPTVGGGDLYLQLMVPEGLLSELLRLPRGLDAPDLLLAVRLESIRRAPFTAAAHADSDDPNALYLEAEAAQFYLARGHLVAFERIR